MDAADKRMLEREALRNMIQQWNANRLDLFELSEPNENLEFHGVMRFYFQDSGQKIATKCIRVASDATVSDVIETLIEKFRPDMRMLSLGSYSLWETHGPEDERRLEPHEKPLLVQLNWHADDREGRFLLKCTTGNEQTLSTLNEKGDQNFKRKLSKREKKELKKKEKLSRMKSDANNENRTAEKLYTEMPETSFTRSISNPEAVMRRRRQQKLERKLQQFRSKDGGPDTGGTLKIYGSSLCPDVPYKTLLLSVRDAAAGVLREMLDKYGLARHDPNNYCIVQVDAADGSEHVLEDDECPLAILMTHPHHSSIMFHVRRRPADAQQPRRRKKKAGGGGGSARPGSEPALLEVAPDGSVLENGRCVRVTDVVEVGSGNGMSLQLYGPSIQPRHCVVATAEGGLTYTVTPLHPDAQVYLNGQRVTHTQKLQHGSLLKFGRVSTFRFVDPAQETILSRNLAQAHHYGSGSIYDRSPTSPARAMSPSSLASQPADLDANANSTNDTDYQRTMSPESASHDTYYNNNTLKLDNESLMLSQHLADNKDEYIRDEHGGSLYDQEPAAPNRTAGSNYKDNYETTFDLEGNVETKSICSAKSGGSGHDNRMNASVPGSRPGQEAILPAVLEFPEAGQAQFLAAVVSRLDPHAPAFKLAPVYTLYLCARYRASTHYRPELSPTERAHKLTAFLHHVATLIHATVQERCSDSAAQAFWMANASELLHFLKCDRHISSFSTQAQELLPTTVQNAFSNLVSCFQEELSPALATLTRGAAADATEATAPTLQALAAAMVLLRRCRVNAALTIQLFSHLFHYVNAVCFNKLVTEPGMADARWGAALAARLALLGAWAERQGLELAADCHLARSHQAARLIQGEYRTAEEVRGALAACFKLNSAQVRALLAPRAPPDVLDAAVAHARALADELYRADGREIMLEESEWLGVGLLIPGDGFSAEVVRGVPPGLAEFVAPLQRGGLCRLAHQPHAAGVWTVYMTGYGAAAARRPPEPRVHIIQLNKNSNGMGLSIVAAKGAGQSKLGIYIKSVVAGGAAAADGRLAAGDQLLSVDGHSLVGITQEKAAEYLVRTGPTVTLEVAKQGAVLHGLATLLHQPAYAQRQGGGSTGALRRASERDLPARLAAEPVKPSKSTPALHHAASPAVPPNHSHTMMSPPEAAWAGKSRSSHNLSAPAAAAAAAAQADAFYQNLPHINDRWSSLRSSGGRPQSAHFSAASPPDSPLHQQQAIQQNAMSVRAAKLAEMSEEVTRRQQHQQMMQQQQLQQQQLQQQQQQLQQQQLQQQQQQLQLQKQYPQKTPHQHMMTPLHLANPHMQVQTPPGQPMSPPHQLYHNHAPPQQRYEWHPPGPPSPQRSQPPVAPKPQGARRPENEHEEQTISSQQQMMSPQQQMLSPQQQMMSPQQQMMLPQQQQMMSPQQQQMMPHQQQLLSPQQQQMLSPQQQQMLAHQQQQMMSPQHPMMSPQQQQMMSSQQHLNNSVQPDEEWYVASATEPPLSERARAAPNPWTREEREREAEARRLQQRARREAAIAALSALGASRSPAQSQQLRALQLERDFERRATLHDQEESTELASPTSPAPASPPPDEPRAAPTQPLQHPQHPQHPQHSQHSQPQPKSILKSNRGDLNGYATDNGRSEERPLVPGGADAAPPPPPERGSSFAVMAARAPPPVPATHPLDNIHTTPTSSQQRDKRVSFHERAAAAPPAPGPGPAPGPAPAHTPSPPPPAPPAASPPPLDSVSPQDPDRFIEEAESMLAGGAGAAAGGAAHTPGVIGAQEVYRDPHARRLAERQAAGSGAAPVPEQLSFKEKMKMFALESGEASTPKDKVKISRAQRDIDAVH